MMNIKNRFNKNPFFFRLLLFNLLIVIFIAALPQVIHYKYFIAAYDESIEKINMQAVQQFKFEIDERMLKEMIDTVNRNVAQTDMNENLYDPMYRDIRNDSMTIIQINRRLGEIRQGLDFVESVDMYYKNNHILFYNNRFCFLETASCDIGFRDNWLTRFQTDESQAEWIVSESEPGRESDGPILTYLRNIPLFAPPGQRKAALAVNISVETIKQMLTQMNPNGKETLFVLDDSGRVISHNRPSGDLFGERSMPWFQRIIQAKGVGKFPVELDGNSAIVSYAKSEYGPWHYVSMVRKDIYYERANELRNLLIVLGIGFLCAGIVISVLVMKRAHKPISNKLNEYSKQIYTLNESLEIHRPVIRHNYIQSLLHGTIDDVLLKNSDAILGVQHKYAHYFSFVIYLHRSKGAAYQDSMAQSYQFIERIERIALEDGYLRATASEENRINGIANLRNRSQVSAVVAMIHSCLMENTQAKFVICCGNAYGEQEGLAFSYKEAREALKYAYLRPDQAVITYAELNISSLRQSGMNMHKQLEVMKQHIRSGDEQRLRMQMEYMVSELRSGPYAIEYCHSVLGDAVSTIQNTIETMGYDGFALCGCHLQGKFQQLESIDHFMIWMEEMIRLALSKISETKQSVDQELIAIVKKYIADELYGQLTLEKVADHVNVSPNYLSKIFKMSTGVTYIEYVTGLKLNEAELLLKKGGLNVGEIAGKLGYHSPTHFIRIFKEKYGQTPKQYQKLSEKLDQAE